MMRVVISEQVANFIRTLAPESRKTMRTALRNLEREEGDIRALEGALTSYCRLRGGGDRLILAYASGGKVVRCIYADRRSVVYDVFEQMIKNAMLRDG